MKVAILLLAVFLSASVAGQELPCVTSITRIHFDEQGHLKRPAAPANVKRHLPRDASVQLVISLSSSETLTIYGDKDSIDPDTRLLVTADGRVLARFAIKDLLDDHEWGRSLTAFGAAHLCANGHNLTYVVLQTGNQGGYFAALTKDNDTFHLLPIKAVQQGRIVVNTDDRSQITVWSVAPEDSSDCTGCTKHYVLETMQFDGNSFKVIEKKETKKKHESFQDKPLVLTPN